MILNKYGNTEMNVMPINLVPNNQVEGASIIF